MPIIVLGDWNDTTPAAPAGSDLAHCAVDRSVDPPKFSVAVKRATTLVYGTIIYDASGAPYRVLGANGVWYSDIRSVGITIDGGGSTPATGSKGFSPPIPFDATLIGWTLLADASGSAQITVKKASHAGFPTTASIVAAAPPKLVTQQINSDLTLTGWTTSLTAGDILEFNLDSVTTCQRIHLTLQFVRR